MGKMPLVVGSVFAFYITDPITKPSLLWASPFSFSASILKYFTDNTVSFQIEKF